MAESTRQPETAPGGSARAPARGPLFRFQKPMNSVVLAASPAALGAVYFFGWRSLAVIVVSVLVAVLCEWLFCRARPAPVSWAVFVTALLFALTLPPGVPWHVIVVCAAVAIVFGKEVFGGFGRNVFNPALVGRCFVYVCFPVAMTGRWPVPFGGWPGGFAGWVNTVDATTAATPLKLLHEGGSVDVARLFLGSVGGSMGETSALLILLGGAYLLIRRVANWRIVVATLASAAVTAAFFHYLLGVARVAPPLANLLDGGMMFGAVFMATDPISAPQTDEARYLYGAGIGFLAVVIRGFGQFSCGVMFSILFMNMFAPIMDYAVRAWKKRRKAAAAATAAAPGAAPPASESESAAAETQSGSDAPASESEAAP